MLCPFYKTDRRCQIKCEGYRADMSSVHREKAPRIHLRQMCQAEYEKVFTREDFIKEFGRSYL